MLFDLDGTLVDTIELLLGSMRHAFTTCAIPAPTDAQWIAGIGTPLRTQLGEFCTSEAQIEALVAAYRAWQGEHHDRLTRTYTGIDDLLARLHAAGHPVGLVTSKADSLAVKALEWVGIARFVDTVVGADSVTRHKPHPEPVHEALRRLGRAPGEAFFVGDSPHDVRSGNAAGVRTVGVLWGPFTRETLERAEAWRIVETVEELERLLTGSGVAHAGIASGEAPRARG